ncbi:MAG: Smr/MutS family protein [Candidatus Binatia bacterium]
MARLERGEFIVRSRLDLHGMVLEDAVNAAASFIAACRQKGERCVLIVTGKGRGSTGGRGVIREELPRWLSDGRGSAAVLAFVTARPRDGGSGALYVLLSKPG